eukprot:TRINITY_DN5993_c0_g2_i1.p1 TRINITY_DN5993_c0_g2~~TRINITY_DN5993_c0_g2_i1.p1  ORF type:complete len:394 (-),score=34.51 TRINITY_DN5993_c0_g2_i1:100-1281(-)
MDLNFIAHGDALTMIRENGGQQKRYFDDEDYHAGTEIRPFKRHQPDPLERGFLPVDIWMCIFSLLLPPTSGDSERVLYCKWTFVPYNLINTQCRVAVKELIKALQGHPNKLKFKYLGYGDGCRPQRRMWAYERCRPQGTRSITVPNTVHMTFFQWRRAKKEFKHKLSAFVQILCEAALTNAELIPFGLNSTKELELLRDNQDKSPAKLLSLNWYHLAHRLPSYNRTKLAALVEDLTVAHCQAVACYSHMIEHCDIDDVVQRSILAYILALDLNRRREVFAMRRAPPVQVELPPPAASPIGRRLFPAPSDQHRRLRIALLQEFPEQCVDSVLNSVGVDLYDEVAVFMQCCRVATCTLTDAPTPSTSALTDAPTPTPTPTSALTEVPWFTRRKHP